MNIVLLLIPLAFILVAAAAAALFWAVDSGQYDHLEDAALTPLESDEPGVARAPAVSVSTDSNTPTRS